jgi:hypothetical protein
LKTQTSAATLRNFGFVVGPIFAGLFGVIVPWMHHRSVPVWPWALGSTLVACAAFAPGLLRYPYFIWDRGGKALGWLNSRIVLNLLFFLIFVPAAVVARLANWDPMRRGFRPDQSTYRIPSGAASPTTMEKPY